MEEKISNHILEVRFRPDGRFLDKRGSIAEQILGGKFDNWVVSHNKIDFTSSKYPEQSAFFSYSNLGVASNLPATMYDFIKTSEEYIKSVWQHFDTRKIIRIGIRSRFLIKTSDFTQAFNLYKNKFLKLNNEKISNFNADLVDLGFALNFLDGDIYFNVKFGPMEKEQSEPIFGEKTFESGIYLEMDYFKKEISPNIIPKHLISFVDDGVKKADNLAKEISKFLYADE